MKNKIIEPVFHTDNYDKKGLTERGENKFNLLKEELIKEVKNEALDEFADNMKKKLIMKLKEKK